MSRASILPVEFTHERWDDPTQRFTGRLDFSRAVTQLCTLSDRTRTIAKIIKRLVKKQNRYPIVLSSRIQVLKDIHSLLGGEMCGLVAGTATNKKARLEQSQATSKRVLLGTDSQLGEGFSDNKRDTIILVTPYKGTKFSRQSKSKRQDGGRLIQLIGRVLRAKNENQPLIVDICDKGTCFERMARGRYMYYNDMNMSILKSYTFSL